MDRFLFRLLITSLLIAFSWKAKALNIVGYEAEPFYYNAGSDGISGACFELLQKYCQSKNETCKFKIAALKKALEIVKNGEADVICPVSRTVAREQFLIYGEKLFLTKYIFLSRPENLSQVKSYEDMKNKSISVVESSAAHESLLKIQRKGGEFKIVPEGSMSANLRKADVKILPLAYANSDVARAWIARNHSPLVEVPDLGEHIFYFIAYSKKNITEDQARRMNEDLRKIMRTQFFTKLNKKYQLKAAIEFPPNEN